MTQTPGQRAEAAAAAYLTGKGLRLLVSNYRCRTGEIDLILRDGEAVVFAEVRLRTHSAFGGAAESIDRRKQARIIAAARHFLTGKIEPACRFDVLLLDSIDPPRIEWIRDAFSLA